MSDLTLNFAGALGFVGIVLALALAILWLTIHSIRPEDRRSESITKFSSSEADDIIVEAVERS